MTMLSFILLLLVPALLLVSYLAGYYRHEMVSRNRDDLLDLRMQAAQDRRQMQDMTRQVFTTMAEKAAKVRE